MHVGLLTWISSLFSGCSTPKNISLPLWNTSQVWSWNEVFDGCEELEAIDFRDFDMYGGFSYNRFAANCTKLKYVYLKNLGNENVYNYYYVRDIFDGSNKSMLVCYNESLNPYFNQYMEENNMTVNCNDDFFK